MAFQVGAAWCFRMRSLWTEHASSFCAGPESCADCSYYRRVMNLPARVLLISADPDLQSQLDSESDGRLELRIVRNGYEASALLSVFQPGYIIADTQARDAPALALVENLARDNRLHGPKIILATPPSAFCRKLDLEGHEIVIGKLAKPIDRPRLLAILESPLVEHPE